MHPLPAHFRSARNVSALAIFTALASFSSPLFALDSSKPQDIAAKTQETWQPESGFISLFNGKDLSGWTYMPGDAFDGKTAASDERYSAADGVLTVHPQAAGPRLRQLWTVQTFPKNFHLKLEFRASVNADSGIFLRKPQLQCRDYWVAGPYYKLGNYKPQDWNTIEVTVKDNVAHCTCNGEVLEEALKLPPDGPVGLEADRGTMEYRHIQIKVTD
jgi:Domain of Unknown Function (DUF1080)